MKKFATSLTVALLLLVASYAAPAPKDETFAGEIMDSQCAILVGHEKMIKKGEDLVGCTVRCVQVLGGKYALFNAATKKAYQLDDQKKAQNFAGLKVKVLGSYNAATKTIKVIDIKPAS